MRAALDDQNSGPTLLPRCGRSSPTRCGTSLTIVATGTLWALPWAALQRSPGDFFGFRPHVLCPSLDLATLLNPEPTADTARPVLWKHSAVLHQHARGLDEAVVLDNTGALRTALLTGSPERSLVAIVGHGRRHDNLTYIELDPGDPLSVADLLGGQLPPRLAMIICGGTETIHDEEPLALGTIVLARGTQQVLTTSMVLADEPTAARVVDAALHRMQQGSTVPEALAASFRRVNETMPLARLPLGRWAALSALGTGGTIRRVETESSGAADGRDHDVNDVAERHHNRR